MEAEKAQFDDGVVSTGDRSSYIPCEDKEEESRHHMLD